MRIKDGYVVREIAGQYMAVPVGKRMNDFHGMLALNETAAFIWNLLKEEKTEQELAEALTDEYEVSFEEAYISVKEFRKVLEHEKLLEGMC